MSPAEYTPEQIRLLQKYGVLPGSESAESGESVYTPEQQKLLEKYKYAIPAGAPEAPAAPTKRQPSTGARIGRFLYHTPPVAASRGFTKAVYGAGKGMAQLALAIANPVTAGGNISKMVQGVKQQIGGIRKSDVAPFVKGQVEELKKDPSEFAGKSLAEITMLLFPSAYMRAGKAIARPFRGRRAAVAGHPIPAAPAVTPAAVAVPGPPTEGVTISGANEGLAAAKAAHDTRIAALKALKVKEAVAKPDDVAAAASQEQKLSGTGGLTQTAKRLEELPAPPGQAGVAPKAVAPSVSPVPVKSARPPRELRSPVATPPRTVSPAGPTPPAPELPVERPRSPLAGPGRPSAAPAPPVVATAAPPVPAPAAAAAAEDVARFLNKYGLSGDAAVQPVRSKFGVSGAAAREMIKEATETLRPYRSQKLSPEQIERHLAKTQRVAELSKPIQEAVAPPAVTPPEVPAYVQPIESTFARGMGHDAATGEFAIQFNDGRVYKIPNVPTDVAQQVLNAPSKGQAFNQLLKGKTFAPAGPTLPAPGPAAISPKAIPGGGVPVGSAEAKEIIAKVKLEAAQRRSIKMEAPARRAMTMDDYLDLIAQPTELKDKVRVVVSRTGMSAAKATEELKNASLSVGALGDVTEFALWIKNRRELIASRALPPIAGGQDMEQIAREMANPEVLRARAPETPIAMDATSLTSPRDNLVTRGKQQVVDSMYAMHAYSKGNVKWWNSLKEATSNLSRDLGFPGAGEILTRVRTVHETLVENIFAPLRSNPPGARLLHKAAREKGIKHMTDVEQRVAYDILIRDVDRSTVLTRRVVDAYNAVQESVALSGRSFRKAIVDLRTAGIDTYSVQTKGTHELANLIESVNPMLGAGDALKHAESLKKLVSGGNPAWSYFRGKGRDLIPPYEIVRDMRRLIPGYIQSEMGDVAFKRVTKMTDSEFKKLFAEHPDYSPWVEAFDRWRGRNSIRGGDIGLDNWARAVRALAAIVFLGPVTAVMQASQLAFVSAKLPWKLFGQGFVEMITPLGRLEARSSAAGLSSIQSLLGEFTHSVDRVGYLGMVADRMQVIADKTLGISLIPTADRMWRYTSFLGKKAELETLVGRLDEPAVRARLAKEGFDFRAIDAGESTLAEQTRFVAKEWTDTFNIKGDWLDAPMWFGSPVGRFGRILNTFNWGVTKMIYTEFLKGGSKYSGSTADRMISIAKFSGTGYAFGTLIAEGRATMLNRERPKHEVWRIAEAYAMVGTWGLFQSVLNGIWNRKGEIMDGGKIPWQMAANLFGMIGNITMGAGPGALVTVSEQIKRGPAGLRRLLPAIGKILDERSKSDRGTSPW